MFSDISSSASVHLHKHTGSAVTRVWWINQSRSYDKERRAGIIYAGHNKEHPARKRVGKIQRGDIVVHNSKAYIRSLSQVQTSPETRTTEVHDGPGYVADVEHFELGDPAYFRDFAEEVYGLSIPNGPIQQNHDGSFGVGQGYCYAFSHEALQVVLDRASGRPSWQALRLEERYPPATQKANDLESGGEVPSQRTETKRREQTVARIVRDSGLARQVKEKAGYQCQICGQGPVELPDGSLYAEAHHLRPLSEEGPDVEENVVCVCPNCHVKLDYGTIVLDHENIAGASESPVGAKFTEYHNDRVAGRT
jgi:5-methylcytosine-specific restriction endonuclease McrA